ncbi:MAG: hypothetical protein JXA11_14915 [Phycisphaerae bacterium]|nr:hypothetical protein [Phycisphaerae bacterium]
MRQTMCRFVGWMLVLGCFVVSPVLGQGTENEGKVVSVKLKDGRELQGVIQKRDDGIVIKTRGGETRVQESEIESIQPVVSPREEYLTRRDQTNRKDAESLCELARWVWENHQDNLNLMRYARDDLKAALELNDKFTRAKLLLRQVNAKIRILTNVSPGPGTPGVPLTLEDRDLVTERDMFWIRLKELRSTDRVMIKYQNKALQRYIDQMRGQTIDNWDRHGKEQHFLAQPRSVQVMEILRNSQRGGAEDGQLLQDIHVMSDPKFMTDFRGRVWPIIQNNCAQANCHGGPKANGGLKFFVVPGLNKKADYTNFLIVSGWRGGRLGEKQLLDRQDIEASLILQYGLNPKVAKQKHPFEIPPVFTGIRSANYRLVYDWMVSLKKPRRPDYHIPPEYQPAGMKLDTTGTPIFHDEDEDEEKKDKEKEKAGNE